jgi:hypothetical protein
MLRTSKKAEKIAASLLGVPVTKESKKSKREDKLLTMQLLKEEERRAR